MGLEFTGFNSIERLESPVTVWEKLDGTNSQIVVDADQFLVGSRNRWITPEDDNFGFARWAYENQRALTEILGPGRHFGEWFGGKIQRGYGLKEKSFALFDTRYKEKETTFIPQLTMCPVLYEGVYRADLVEELLLKLKTEGSVAAPGFMNPEGVVLRFHRNGALFKKVFDEVKVPKIKKDQPEPIDITPYLQDERLKSILSKDERLLMGYPETLVQITKLYAEDLVKEAFEEIPEDVLKSVKRHLFAWVREKLK